MNQAILLQILISLSCQALETHCWLPISKCSINNVHNRNPEIVCYCRSKSKWIYACRRAEEENRDCLVWEKSKWLYFSFHLSWFDTQALNSNIVPCVFFSLFLVLNGAVSPSVGIWCDPPKKNNDSMTAFILPVGIKIIIIKKHVKLMPDNLNFYSPTPLLW